MNTATKILLIGSRGFLGSSLREKLAREPFPLDACDRSQLDLASPDAGNAIRLLLQGNRYSHVLVCAAVTDVDACYRQPEHSRRINVEATKEILSSSREAGAVPVFFSSDYVFGSAGRPAAEDSLRAPETEYGRQKKEIEDFLAESFPDFVVFRTSKLMAKTLHPRSILTPLLRNLAEGRPVRCFSDQWINAVFVEDIAEAIRRVVQGNARGFFHLGTQEIFSRLELAHFLARSLGLDSRLIQAVSLADLRLPEPRPHHNTLDCRKAREALGLRFSELHESLPALGKLLGLSDR